MPGLRGFGGTDPEVLVREGDRLRPLCVSRAWRARDFPSLAETVEVSGGLSPTQKKTVMSRPARAVVCLRLAIRRDHRMGNTGPPNRRNVRTAHESKMPSLTRPDPPSRGTAAPSRLAAKVQPLDRAGKLDSNGKIVLPSVGMSNATQAFEAFKKIADAD
jgi:hypothetical protein